MFEDSFMKPEIVRCDFHQGETARGGEIVAVPADVYGDVATFETKTRTYDAELIVGKVWARLSASGYMDCTDWDGPFDTEEAALAHLNRCYGDE